MFGLMGLAETAKAGDAGLGSEANTAKPETLAR